MLSDAVLEKFSDTKGGNAAREFFLEKGLPKKMTAEFHYFDLKKALELNAIPSGADWELGETTQYDLDISVYHDGIIIMESSMTKPHSVKEFDPQVESDASEIDKLVAGFATGGHTFILPSNSEVTMRLRHGGNTNKQFELVIGENSKVTLFEEVWGQGGFGSCHFTIALKESAKLNHFFTSDNKEQISFIRHRVIVHKNAHYEHGSIWFGSKSLRHDLAVYLLEKKAQCQICGTYLIENEHLDFSCFVSHQDIECKSNVNVRGVVGENGQAVFQGKIEVIEDAQKTIGNMQHRGLMLQEGARIYSKPCLEIYADDVECSHANTIGALDETALFYMQSRGISKKIAKQVLTNAFLGQVFDTFEDEALHEKLIARLEKRLGEIVS